jgi:adenosine deaminase
MVMGDVYKKLGEETYPIRDSFLKPGPIKLIPHVGEEHYGGEKGEEVLESVNAFLHFNEETVIESLKTKGIDLAFKLERIGHGCQCARNDPLLVKLQRQNMTCEVCITSNDKILSTKVNNTAIFPTYPVLAFIEKKVPIVLCSDDPAIFTQGRFGCILNGEYIKLYKLLIEFGKSPDETLMELKEIANRSINKSLALSDNDVLKQKYISENDALI